MPVIASAKKALRRDRRRTIVNRRIRIKVKTALDVVKADSNEKTIASGYSALDRAVKKQVMHKNKAARLKSRLAKATPAVPAKAAPANKKASSKPKKKK
jgi:small subunit ribosomal protein S20